MKKKTKNLCIVILGITLMLSTLLACGESQSTKNPYTKIIMENIEQWEYVSDDFTKETTSANIEISHFYLFEGENPGEYYFVTGYKVPKSWNTNTLYGKMFYLTENSFEYICTSNDSEYTSMTKTKQILGDESIPEDTKNKEEYVENIIELIS